MTADPDEQLVTVHVDHVPIDVQTAAQQHGDELTRELQLVAEHMHQRGDTFALPQRFVEVVTTLSSRYSIFTAEQEKQLRMAAAAGLPTIDLVYRVPASAGAAAVALGEIYDEVDAYCRQGRLLLTLETPPALVTYRRWFLDQFVQQTQGRPAVSWPDYRDRAEAVAQAAADAGRP